MAPVVEQHRSHLQIAGVVLTYWTISLSMVFCNKALVGASTDTHDFSLFISWFQSAATVLSVIVGCWIKSGPGSIPPISRDVLFSKNLIALSVLFTGMLTFNNLCLKHVGIAFFQIARSMTLIFTVALSALILKRPASFQVVLCCVLVALGFVLGVDQEGIAGTLSVRGVAYGITTSLFVALVGIYTKRALETVDKDVVRITYYNNFNAMLILLPICIFSGQFTGVLTERASDTKFWAMLTVTGMLSFLIGWASNMQIDYTSPVTHHISNNTKSVLQTVIAVMVGHEFKPWLWWFSMALVVAGAFCYAIVKIREQENERSLALQAALAHNEKGDGNAV